MIVLVRRHLLDRVLDLYVIWSGSVELAEGLCNLISAQGPALINIEVVEGVLDVLLEPLLALEVPGRELGVGNFSTVVLVNLLEDNLDLFGGNLTTDASKGSLVS